jgi:hypothetical protein
MRRAHVTLAVLSIAAVFALACSISYSVDQSSDSSKSSSDSSRSSSPENSARFHEDVEQYTAAYVRAGGRDESAFRAGLGDLARKRGVSDWESEPGTWEAIGRGLARATPTEEERRAYQQAWAGDDAARERALDRGYEAPH